MKKTLIILLLGIVTLSATAQEKIGSITIVPRVGVTLANITNNYQSVAGYTQLKSKSQAGFVVGADAWWQATDIVALSAGVSYSSLGCKFDNCDVLREQPAETDTEIKYTAYTDNFITLNYVSVPVLVHVYVAKGLALKAGIQAGLLTGVKETHTTCDFVQNRTTGVRTYAQNATEHKLTSKDDYRKTDFSIPVGVSYEYMQVVLEARYNFGLSKVYREGSSHNRAFTFTVGYRL